MNKCMKRLNIFARSYIFVVCGVALPLTPALSQSLLSKPILEAPIADDPAPAGFSDWNAVFAEQHRLNAAADRIFEAVNGPQMRRDPQSVFDEGYAGLEVKPESHEVKLYWRGGALPLRIQDALAQARLKAPVRVIPAQYSKQQLLAEGRRWMTSGLANGAVAKEDGSGLVIDTRAPQSAIPLALPGGSNIPTEIRYSSKIQSLDIQKQALDSLVPVTCNASTPYNRQCDTEPYYGGARYNIFKPGIGWYGLCTFAFPVDSQVNGFNSGFLTALHCMDRNSDGAYKMDQATLIGLSANNVASWLYPIQQERDTSRIKTIGSVSQRIYTGDWKSNKSRGIAGTTTAYVGNFVRPSGASSGEHSNVRITYVDGSVELNSGAVLRPVVEAISTQFTCAAAPGDSGGPAFIYSGLNNDWRIYIVGHIIAGNASAQCPGAVPNGHYVVYLVEAAHSLWVTETTLRTTSDTSQPAH
jgi:hypothetical protein